MPYRYSQLDKSNLDWFEKDKTKASLIRLEIRRGNLRGLEGIKIHFKYPITVISGKNGTGKSTLLACAACAYKNRSGDERPLSKKSYDYKFSDFFIQSEEETAPEDVVISHQTLDSLWWGTPTGLGWDSCYKRRSMRHSNDPFDVFTMLFGNPAGGRWTRRRYCPRRDVVYLGIDRVVPHAEKSVSKSYRKAFKKAVDGGYEKAVREVVGRVIGRQYNEFYFKTHSKYRLPLVESRGTVYSGFNMGTGENTLFEIFSTVFACKGSLLLVVDEIELGLHEEAQIRLIEELKKICNDRHIQIICTTHSSRIINSLPPEARLHLEMEHNVVKVIPEISADYAAGLMSGIKHAELDIICEDEVARNILMHALPNEVRSRVEIKPIGSSAAAIRYMAFRLKDSNTRAVCCFLDGDQASVKQKHVSLFMNALEQVKNQEEAKSWIENRLSFLPGTTSPEKWVVSKRKDGAFKKLAKEFGVTDGAWNEYLEAASLAEKHNEFYELAKRLNQDATVIEGRFIQCALEKSKPEVRKLVKSVQKFLD